MEIVIYFAIGTLLGATITTIAHRMGSKTTEKAIEFIMHPQSYNEEDSSSTNDVLQEDMIYNFQAPEDALNMYDGVQVDQPHEDDNREPNNDEFKEI